METQRQRGQQGEEEVGTTCDQRTALSFLTDTLVFVISPSSSCPVFLSGRSLLVRNTLDQFFFSFLRNGFFCCLTILPLPTD